MTVERLRDIESTSLIEAAPDAVLIVDPDGRILLVNEQTERMFGYARAELLGGSVEMLLPERYRGRHSFHRASYQREPRARPMGTGLDLFGVRKSGEEFPLEISLSPIPVRDGTLVFAAIRDITERKAAERELDRLRHQQELLLASVQEGILGLDPRGVITFANPAAAKILGYRAEELVGRAEHELFHAKRHDGTPYPVEMCPIHRSVHDGTTHHASGEVFWRRDGRSIPVDYTSAPIREHGHILGASIIFSDVSERQKRDEILRSANKRVMSVYEGIPEAFVALDKELRVVYLNPLAERMRGGSKGSALGQPIWDVFPDLASAERQADYRRALEQERRVTTEEHVPASGRWFEATAYPSDEGLSVYYRDITERKRGEDALRVASISRPLARRIVQDLVEQGAVAHQILTQVGRKLGTDAEGDTLAEQLRSYREMGLGNVDVEKRDGTRYSFTGSDLLERRPGSRVATCSFTLGFLSEIVSRAHRHEPTLGTEIECQSRGAPKCRFVVQVKKAEEGLARRVKELI